MKKFVILLSLILFTNNVCAQTARDNHLSELQKVNACLGSTLDNFEQDYGRVLDTTSKALQAFKDTKRAIEALILAIDHVGDSYVASGLKDLMSVMVESYVETAEVLCSHMYRTDTGNILILRGKEDSETNIYILPDEEYAKIRVYCYKKSNLDSKVMQQCENSESNFYTAFHRQESDLKDVCIREYPDSWKDKASCLQLVMKEVEKRDFQ